MKKRLVLSTLSFILGLISILGNPGLFITACAADTNLKTVRIGYYSGNDNLQTGFSDEERKSGYAYEYYQTIAPIAGWQYEYVYGTREEILELLRTGEVDIMAGFEEGEENSAGFLISSQNLGVGEGEHFAIAPGRTDLLQEMDDAMAQIQVSLPGFSANLGVKYNTRIATRQEFTQEEKDWLKNHSKTHEYIRCGYVRHNLPLSDQDKDGNPMGVAKDMMEETASILGTEVVGVCFENITEMESALSAGKICCAFPMYSDYWITES